LLGNDEDTDQLHWSVRAANDLAIHSLAQAGYDAQWLKAMLEKKEEERPITQPNTVKRQQALADVHTHGGCFHLTEGMHVTSDDFFISHEIGKNKEVCKDAEKDKKQQHQLQMTEERALAIVAQGKSVDSLLVTELDALLAWHQADKTKGAKKADKLEQWKKILSDGHQLPEYEQWTEEDEERLLALCVTKIEMKDTQYGQELALKERELEAAADKMSREKRDALRWKFDKLDAEKALVALTSSTKEESLQVIGESGGV
jgi:hypothetical protein